ncbi:family 16 glycosyl hydrolase [Coprinopsis sp. MPI-PUGE-AT-0042]|nr:family 16 glycosyl hydrolase [Coprinopsis sp. MPI-PUGE-AT-0042]
MPSPSILFIFLTSWALGFVHAHKPGQAHGGIHRPAKLVRTVNKSTEDISARNNDGVNKYWKTVWYEGSAFIDEFDFENIEDPTHGRVNYVDKNTAIQRNLAVATEKSFILRTDCETVLDPNGPGRNSVRIKSKRAFTDHVAVFDIRHMPEGCGTWPAIWEVGPDWPHGGELDILEGVNDEGTNAATLHTSPGCRMPFTRDAQRGVREYEDCDATVNNNVGCPVAFPQPESFGPSFNQAGGGWYAVERSASHIKVWFWSRNDPTVPSEIKDWKPYVKPDEWGTPSAFFPSTSCNISKHFNEHNIIINLTLCGDWAGQTYGQTSCPGTCVDRVNNDPASFKNAFFDMASIRVYEK